MHCLITARTDIQAVNVLGGMTAWNAAGYPTVTED